MAAMSWERLLLAAIVATGDMSEPMERRINEEFFDDDEHREVFRFILKHWTDYSKVPSAGELKRNYPAYKLPETTEPLRYYVDQMCERRQYSIVQDALVRATDALQDDAVGEALAALSAGLQDAHAQGSVLRNDVLTQEWGKRLKLYQDFARHPGRLRGMSTGFHTIDRATRGIQPEQYIALVGAQKSGKSTIMMHMAVHLNKEHDARVLMISFEMSREEQWARHDALRAKVSHTQMLDGKLKADGFKKLRKAFRDMEECEDFVLSTDISACTTVSGIRAQVEQAKPDVVFIDGVYLMLDERGERPGTPQALTNISRDIKRMAQATKIPVVVSTQALEHKMTRRQGISAASVGYSSAFGQDCDVMLGLERIPERENITALRVLLSRCGPLAHTEVEINWDSGTIKESDPPEDNDDPNAQAPCY